MRAVIGLLSDGQWHERAVVVETGAVLVPVAFAARFGVRRDSRRGIARPDQQSTAVLLRNSREIMGDCLRGLIRNGRLETDGSRLRLVDTTGSGGGDLAALAGRLAALEADPNRLASPYTTR